MDIRFFPDRTDQFDPVIGIASLLGTITTREGSHKGGWARLLKCQLTNAGFTDVKILDNKDKLTDFDAIIFDLGAEYSGTLNMFGGLDEKVFKRLSEIRDFKGPIFSWKHELPSLNVLSGRKNNSSTCQAFKDSGDGFLGSVQQILDTCKVFDHTYCTKSVLIGDSHTPSIWSPEFMIERQDGRTLFGAVKDMTIERIVSELKTVENVMIHMSNIDVRHHLCRQQNPEISTIGLAQALCDQLNSVRQMFRLKNITVCRTVGIEDVSRELPKTGFYKGTPYFGTWEQRDRIRQIYNASIQDVSKQYGFNVLEFPWAFFDESGKLKFDVMEKPGSVHLSPEFYLWDLDTNKRRWE